MRQQLQDLGKWGIGFGSGLGRAGVFLSRILFRVPNFKKSFGLLTREMFSVGVLSFSIIVVSAMFIGMVVALQGYNTLVKFSAEQEIGQLITLSVVRELGPVVTALLFAGRAGSALTAEIGLMKATEQLASMEMMGVDPIWRVISPRFWASCYAMPILATIFNAVAILCGYWLSTVWLGIDAGAFWNNTQTAVDFRIDVVSGFIKSCVFGVMVAWIAVFQGYDTVPTAEGIGRSTTRTVVYASLVVLAMDLLLTTVMLGDW